jgi:septal ring factor EnvC (AmiA/AmiB activator)
MGNEKIEKQMEFILEHQAQFTARMGQLEDLVVRLARGTLERFEATDARVDDVDERISALVNSQIRTEENVKKTEENVKKTEENVKKTDESLRRLIAVVDRYFSEGRNGNSKE